ncbi:hypothetical protein ACFX2H_004559 [Malus domestica]
MEIRHRDVSMSTVELKDFSYLWAPFPRVIITMVLLVCFRVPLPLPQHIIMHPPTPPLWSYGNLKGVKEPESKGQWRSPHSVLPGTDLTILRAINFSDIFNSPKSET